MLGAADRGKHRNLKNLRQTRVRDQKDCQGSGRERARGEKGNHEMRWPWVLFATLDGRIHTATSTEAHV